jgi:hypothetical protein
MVMYRFSGEDGVEITVNLESVRRFKQYGSKQTELIFDQADRIIVNELYPSIQSLFLSFEPAEFRARPYRSLRDRESVI